MINAGRVASEIASMLPLEETPEMTEGYEGFFHLTGIEGNVEKHHSPTSYATTAENCLKNANAELQKS